MSAKTQNPIPPVFPMGVCDAAPGAGAATVFPMGQTGLLEIAFTVVGAGTAAVNGWYAEIGTFNGKPSYRGGAGYNALVWWITAEQQWWIQLASGDHLIKYTNDTDSGTPPESAWSRYLDWGDLPVPTLSYPA